MRISVASLHDAVILAPNHHQDEVIGFAASELQRYLERMTGAKLPVADDGCAADGRFTVKLDVAQSDLPHDAFRITVAPGSILL